MTTAGAPAKTAAAAPPIVQTRTRSAAIMIRFRGKRSPSSAAKGATAAAGRSRTSATSPTAVAPPALYAKTARATS